MSVLPAVQSMKLTHLQEEHCTLQYTTSAVHFTLQYTAVQNVRVHYSTVHVKGTKMQESIVYYRSVQCTADLCSGGILVQCTAHCTVLCIVELCTALHCDDTVH